jgi:hypothetical protein
VSTKNRTPRRAPANQSLKNLTAAQERPADRLRKAIQIARQMQRQLKAGDEDALAQATLLQGVLSGDVIAASIHARQRLQRENLRLRARLTHARLKTEAAKQLLLQAEASRSIRTQDMNEDAYRRIRDLYGLDTQPFHALPAANVTVPQTDNIPPTESSKVPITPEKPQKPDAQSPYPPPSDAS